MTITDSMAKKEKKTNDIKHKNQEISAPISDNNSSERSLDVAEEASASVRELNNVILKLKPIVKQAKSRTIQKVVRQIQKLKKTKGSDEKVEKSRTKAERLLDEIYTIKSLELEQLAQYSLGNTSSFFHLSSQKDVPVEIKAMTRVSETPKVQEYVKSFRAKHKDWEKLGDFMLFKQSGRRYKHATSDNRVERIKASEALVKTYIDKKFSGNKDKIKKVESISEHVLTKPRQFKQDTSEGLKNSDCKEVKKDIKPQKRKLFRSIATANDADENDNSLRMSSPKPLLEPKSLNVSSNSQKSACLKDASELESDDTDSHSDESDDKVIPDKLQNDKVMQDSILSGSESDSNEDITDTHVTSNIPKNDDSSSSESENDPQSDDSEINTELLSKVKIPGNDQKLRKKDAILKPKKKSSKVTMKVTDIDPVKRKIENENLDDDFVIKKNNDMVVRKIDWDNFGIGSDFRPSFNKSIPEIKKRRQKNDFFENDGDEFDEEEDNDVKDVVPEDDKEEVKGYGRSLIESAFVKSLGGGPRPRNQVVDRERKKLEIQVKRELNSKKKQQEKKDSKNRQSQTKPGKYQQNKAQNTKGSKQTESVHPSWAASLKRKQEQGAISAFQGKKIKFDD